MARSSQTVEFVEKTIQLPKVIMIGKSGSPECKQISEILRDTYRLSPKHFEVLNIDKRQDCSVIEDYLHFKYLFDRREVPHLFVCGDHVGGFDKVWRLHESGKLKSVWAGRLQ